MFISPPIRALGKPVGPDSQFIFTEQNTSTQTGVRAMKKKTHRMKTAGKKLTVLALACGMTISMMPFQAAAATES